MASTKRTSFFQSLKKLLPSYKKKSESKDWRTGRELKRSYVIQFTDVSLANCAGEISNEEI
jgi:hypothetical protein